MIGSKTSKNFFIRPTTGVGSKGGFSVERREQIQKREPKNGQFYNDNNNNNNNNNVLISVNSYGFKLPNYQAGEDNDQNGMIRGASRGGMRQDNMNNGGHDEDKLLQRQQIQFRVNNFSNLATLNNGSSQQRLHTPLVQSGTLMTNKYPHNQQLHQQYRMAKHRSQEHFKEDPLVAEALLKKNISSSSKDQEILNVQNSQKGYPYASLKRNNERKQDAAFELDISEVKHKQDAQDDSNDCRKEENEEEEEDNQQEQLSEIRINEIQNFEDSFNKDIQDLATSGFDLVKKERPEDTEKIMKRENIQEFSRSKSIKQAEQSQEDWDNLLLFGDTNKRDIKPLEQKKYETQQSPQFFSNHKNNPSSKNGLDWEDTSGSMSSDPKKVGGLQMKENKLSAPQYNFTSSKQFDETASSQHLQNPTFTSMSNNNNNLAQTSHLNSNSHAINSSSNRNNTQNNSSNMYNNNTNTSNNIIFSSTATNFKENNNFKLISLKSSQTTHDPRIIPRPPTTSLMNRGKTASNKLLEQQMLTGGDQINFYELFAGQMVGGALKNNRGPVFHNFYKSEQLKNLTSAVSAPITTFSVKKAQLFSMPNKHINTPSSRQGQRIHKFNNTNTNNNNNKEIVLPSSTDTQNIMASKIQQQLILGITGKQKALTQIKQ